MSKLVPFPSLTILLALNFPYFLWTGRLNQYTVQKHTNTTKVILQVIKTASQAKSITICNCTSLQELTLFSVN